MSKRGFIFGTLACFVLLASCSYNKTELPEPEKIIVVAETSVTYTNDVKTIIDNNCVSCHGGQNGLFLNNYSQVKAIADSGDLLFWAIQGGGSQPMPTGGLLPQATLDILQSWLDQGALE